MNEQQKELNEETYLAINIVMNLKVGDKVKVMFAGPTTWGSHDISWVPLMDATIGEIGIIKQVETYGIEVKTSYGRWNYPCYCLEKQVVPQLPKLRIGDTCSFDARAVKSALLAYESEYGVV